MTEGVSHRSSFPSPSNVLMGVSGALALLVAGVALTVILTQAHSWSGAWAFITHEGCHLFGSFVTLEAVSLVLFALALITRPKEEKKPLPEKKVETPPVSSSEEEEGEEELEVPVEKSERIEKKAISHISLAPFMKSVEKLGTTIVGTMGSLEGRKDADQTIERFKECLEKAKTIPNELRNTSVELKINDEHPAILKYFPQGFQTAVVGPLDELKQAEMGVISSFLSKKEEEIDSREMIQKGARFVAAAINLIGGVSKYAYRALILLVKKRVTADFLSEKMLKGLKNNGFDMVFLNAKMKPCVDDFTATLYYLIELMGGNSWFSSPKSPAMLIDLFENDDSHGRKFLADLKAIQEDQESDAEALLAKFQDVIAKICTHIETLA